VRAINIVLWLWGIGLVTLGALGFVSRAETPPGAIASPRPDGPWQIPEPPRAKSFSMPPAEETRPELTPPDEKTAGFTSGPKCPLRRVAMVRDSDSEASEGGGFTAARANGIHGALDLDGFLGEPVFAVADGKVAVAAERDLGKLGKTVVVDHVDGGHTIYGHLDTVDVKLNSTVTAGQMLGTIGYSGNAKRLREKKLPPHLHFAYVRGVMPFTRIRDSADGLAASFVRSNAMGAKGVLHPDRAVGFRKCWEDPMPATKRSVVALP
jgi:murein DD-endopeptidase MepM/ murein hydrolase activator NlpD